MTGWDAPTTLPPPSRWRFPPADSADRHGLVGVGADLEPGTLLSAYVQGLFPMPLRKKVLGWWSPDPRGVIPLDGLRVSRSLRQSRRRFRVTLDERFTEVVQACADPRRPHGWITDGIIDAYTLLHQLGWAHSIEVLDEDDRLVGGLYGVRIGGLFAGESMFHRARDASKVALVELVERMRATAMSLLDIQWTTPHLVSLGAVDIPRAVYLEALRAAVDPDLAAILAP